MKLKTLSMIDSNVDEIDLIKVFKTIIKFFKHHLTHFSILIVLGTIIGITTTILRISEYKSSMSGISTILTTEDVFPMVAKLNSLLSEGNIKEVAKLIPIDTISLSHIKRIEVTNEILIKKNKVDDEEVTNKFHIIIQVTDNTLFDTLNVLIPNFIKNNKYTKLKTHLSMERMQKNYNRLDKEIKLLDSIKNKLTPGKITKDNLNLYMSNPSAINETIIALYEKQSTLYETMQMSPDFMVIDNFAAFKKPINKNYIKNAAIGAAVFFFLGLTFLIASEINKLTKA